MYVSQTLYDCFLYISVLVLVFLALPQADHLRQQAEELEVKENNLVQQCMRQLSEPGVYVHEHTLN